MEIHFEVRDSIPGLGEMQVEGGEQLATLRSDQIVRAADGSYEIQIGGDALAAPENHLAVPERGVFNVGVRQLFTDWGEQDVASLELVALGGGLAPMRLSVPRVAERAAHILDRIAPYWLDYNNRYIFCRPANEIGAPRTRPGGRGLSASGHYSLDDDEALVVTIATLDAGSMGAQIADPWGVAYDYWQRTSSLNAAQARPNTDGTYSLVISSEDPGVWNWLDSGGYGAGIIVLRWQVLPENVDPSRAIVSIQRVPRERLRSVLAAETSWTNEAMRASQRRERAGDYARRLALYAPDAQ